MKTKEERRLETKIKNETFELDKLNAFLQLLSGKHPSKIKNLKLYFPYSFINDLE